MDGNWNIDVKVGELPEKIASAIPELAGATYDPIAYLGNDANNHAILAVQHETTEDASNNIVVMIFAENDMSVSLTDIKKVLKGASGEGGIIIDVDSDLPADANDLFDKALHNFVGSVVKPFALLATQITDRVKFYFAVEITPVTEVPVKHVSIVTIDSANGTVHFKDIL